MYSLNKKISMVLIIYVIEILVLCLPTVAIARPKIAGVLYCWTPSSFSSSSPSSSSCGKCAGEQLIVADIVLPCSPPPLVYNQPSLLPSSNSSLLSEDHPLHSLFLLSLLGFFFNFLSMALWRAVKVHVK